MNTYHVNKWLISPWWHCGAMRMQSYYFYFTGFGGSFVGIFGGQSGTQESLGTSYLKFILQLKGPISKWIFFLFGWTCKYQAGLFRAKDWTGLPWLQWAKLQKAFFFLAVATKLRKGFPAIQVWDGILNWSAWHWCTIYGVPHSGTGIILGEHGGMALELKQVQGMPYKRAALDKSALSKVGNLSPEQMVCWTWDRLPQDTLFWNKAKAAWLKAQIHASKEQVYPHT